MLQKTFISDIGSLKISVVFKRSRFEYAQKNGSKEEQRRLENHSDPIISKLFAAHEKNMRCIEKIEKALNDLRLNYSLIDRAQLASAEINNSLVISVGGDGTLLDTSHYCVDSAILGVNSDPENSIGALCSADEFNFSDSLQMILAKKVLPIPLTRLAIYSNGKVKNYRPLNDVLFCHENPAAMSRFNMSFLDHKEDHRSSGIWISTPAGSSGGIFSSGADAIPLDAKRAIFRIREPYWSATKVPQLLDGSIENEQRLVITSAMSDAKLFIDGPHKVLRVPLGQSIEIGISPQPLWMFEKESLLKKRKTLLSARQDYRNVFKIL